MNQDQLKKLIKERIKKLIDENQPSPSKSPKPDVLEPDTDTPSRPERRRTLTPPKEAPKTRPKATNENEEELLNKIATKYRSLKSKNDSKI